MFFFWIFLSFSMTKWSIFTCFGGADEQSSTPRARSSLFAKKCSSVDHAMVHMGGGG